MELRVGQNQGQRIASLSRRAGLGRVTAALRTRSNVRVVLLHDVGPDLHGRLGAMLGGLLSAREPLAPDQLLAICSGRAPWVENPSFAVTFDDGLLSSYEAAKTVLEPLGLRAAFFVPTAIFDLGTEEEMRAFRASYLHGAPGSLGAAQALVMSREQVRELHERGHAVFPHTHSHMPVARISTPELIETELRRPRAIVEELIESPAPALALPYGDDRSVGSVGFAAVRQIYEVSWTAVPGVNTPRTDPYFLHRDGVHPANPPSSAEDLFSGALDIPYLLKMRRLQRAARETTHPTPLSPA
jgi:peptidoglycan/xylan/chitin deacetylase (PgdA/CDA1 family)